MSLSCTGSARNGKRYHYYCHNITLSIYYLSTYAFAFKIEKDKQKSCRRVRLWKRHCRATNRDSKCLGSKNKKHDSGARDKAYLLYCSSCPRICICIAWWWYRWRACPISCSARYESHTSFPKFGHPPSFIKILIGFLLLGLLQSLVFVPKYLLTWPYLHAGY